VTRFWISVRTRFTIFSGSIEISSPDSTPAGGLQLEAVETVAAPRRAFSFMARSIAFDQRNSASVATPDRPEKTSPSAPNRRSAMATTGTAGTGRYGEDEPRGNSRWCHPWPKGGDSTANADDGANSNAVVAQSGVDRFQGLAR
jgi:hypothetical protein